MPHHRRWMPRLITTAMLVFGAAASVLAADQHAQSSTPSSSQVHVCPICGRANNDQAGYSEKAAMTLARGATNTIFGWTEIIRQPADSVRNGDTVLDGIGKGVQHSIKRTLGGVGELLTFWMPKSPSGYVRFTHDCPLCMGSDQKK